MVCSGLIRKSINKSLVRVRECKIVLLVLGVGLGNKYHPILEDEANKC